MTIGTIRPPANEATYASGGMVVRLGENTAAAIRSAEIAALAANSASAAGHYFPSQAAGEAGSSTGQFFSHPDGSGGLIYRERTSGGSTIIAYAATKAQVDAKVPTADLAGAEGASLVGWIAARTGAVLRSVADWFQDQHSIMDYIPLAERVKIRLRTSTADIAPYLQQAADNMSEGGELIFPNGLYRLSSVQIANRNIHVSLAPGAVLTALPFTGFNRAIFQFDGLQDAGFRLSGGRVDLNQEGPMRIGEAGRIPNNYAFKTVPAVITIGNNARAAIYAVRSSGISVEDTAIENSGENGLLFRNCGKITVRRTRFSNIANWGIEFSFTALGGDGSSAPMPARDDVLCEDLTFEDMTDYGLGSGNGGCIGGGVSDGQGLGFLTNYIIRNIKARRVWRGVQFEAPYGGTFLDRITCESFDFEDVGQNVLAMVGMTRFRFAGIRVNRLGQAAHALFYVVKGGSSSGDYPDVAAIILSGDFDSGVIDDVNVRDDRQGGTVVRGDGVIAAGSLDVLTSAGANFTAADVGKSISVVNAGPNGNMMWETFIEERISATSVRLRLPARAAVNGVSFGYGGHTRRGIMIKADRPRATDGVTITGAGGRDVSIVNSSIEAGATSGLPNEPEGCAISASGMKGVLRLKNTNLFAPTNGTAAAKGLLTSAGSDGWTGQIDLDNSNKVNGFTVPYSGIYAPRPPGLKAQKSFPLDRSLSPSSTANTYGDTEVLYPDAPSFQDLLRASFATVGSFAGGETITFKIGLAEFDGQPVLAPIEKTLSASGTVSLDAGDLLRVNPNNAPFKAVSIAMKSSVAASAVTGKANATARQL